MSDITKKKTPPVVPTVLINPPFFKPFFWVLMLFSFFLPASSFADTHDYGCRFGNRIFQNYDLAHPSTTNFQYDSDGNGSPNGYSDVNSRCDDGSTLTCTIYDYDETTIRGYGLLADFSIEYCSFDDYVGILLIFVTVAGLGNLPKTSMNPQ